MASDERGTPQLLVAFVVAMLGVIGGIVLLALTDSVWALIGAVGLTVLLLAAVLWDLEWEIGGRPARARAVPENDAGPVAGSAPESWRGPRGHRRVLLVVSEPLDRSQLAEILQDEPRRNTAVLVVAPALQGTWLRYWVSDTDEGYEHARAVEEATLDVLRSDGVATSGHVGSAEPLAAIEDALRFFDADRIVIAIHPGDERRYRERDLRADVERRFDLPTEEYEVSAA